MQGAEGTADENGLAAGSVGIAPAPILIAGSILPAEVAAFRLYFPCRTVNYIFIFIIIGIIISIHNDYLFSFKIFKHSIFLKCVFSVSKICVFCDRNVRFL